MSAEGLKLQIDQDNIAWLGFDLPGKKVNILTTPVMLSLGKIFSELSINPGVKAVILLSKKKDNFIAGADIGEVAGITSAEAGTEKSSMGQRIFAEIEELKIPVIAAIDGICLGGGTELALACHYRIASDNEKTKIGCPEVNLGVIPGFGGTKRLPGLVGLAKALEMVLTARSLSAAEAEKTGLVDKIAPQPIFLAAVKKFAKEVAARRPARKVRWENWPFIRSFILSLARRSVLRQTRGNYPAPLAAVQVIGRGFSLKLPEAQKIEARAFGKLVATEVSKNLISIYYMGEELKKFTGSPDSNIKPLPINKIGVLGAGLMGSGIVQVISFNDIPVRMRELKTELITRGLRTIRKTFLEAVRRQKISLPEMERRMHLLSGTTDYSGFGRADLVIEAVAEKMEIKKKVLREVERINPQAIFASNTSSLSITEIASVSKRPSKVIGMHFFNPPHKMRLVEIIRGKETGEGTVVTAVALAKRLGKIPIVVKDSPGFLVNRILMPYLNEAGRLLQEGAKIAQIDQAMLDYGLPLGPLALLDLVGLDIAVEVARVLYQAFGERLKPAEILRKVLENGRLGKKSGRGFYLYRGKKRIPDEGLARRFRLSTPQKISGKEIETRLIQAMKNEAQRCLEEKIVLNVNHLNTALILGIGFPPFRGGLL